MAEITRQRVGELLRGVFSILLENPEGLPAKTVIERLEQSVPPTEYEREDYPNRPDVRRYERIARFSTIAPVKAGWMTKSRGWWNVTEAGKEAYERYQDPAEFAREASRLYRRWKAEQPDEADVEEESAEAAATVEEAEETAWTEIESYLSELNPYDFQHLVAGLLRGMGYYVTWVAPPGPDKGIDIIAQTDPLGVQGPRIKVQVKRMAEKTSVQGVRSFMAVLSDGDVGLFVSTGGFTKDAESETRGQEKRRLMLLDLPSLFDLWVEHYEKIPETYRRLLPLKAVHFLALSE